MYRTVWCTVRRVGSSYTSLANEVQDAMEDARVRSRCDAMTLLLLLETCEDHATVVFAESIGELSVPGYTRVLEATMIGL